jgi:hypothetical protein
MIDFALVMLALVAGGGAYAFYATGRAPFGYEDDQGFHYATAGDRFGTLEAQDSHFVGPRPEVRTKNLFETASESSQ